MWKTHLAEVQDLEEFLNMIEEDGEEVKSIFFVSGANQVCIVSKVREDSSIREILFGKKPTE